MLLMKNQTFRLEGTLGPLIVCPSFVRHETGYKCLVAHGHKVEPLNFGF